MKGVAAWIWIILGVVLGILVVVFGSTLILQQYDLTQKQLIINNFQTFYGKIKNVCTEGGVGEIHYYQLAIPENTRAIYASNASDSPPPDKVSEYITKSKSSVGNYLCLQFFDENIPRCGQLACYTNFTYIGTPSLQPTLQSIVARLTGQSPVYYFLIFLNKTNYYYLAINATQTIGPQAPSTVTATRII
jgi:hypothetical protein